MQDKRVEFVSETPFFLAPAVSRRLKEFLNHLASTTNEKPNKKSREEFNAALVKQKEEMIGILDACVYGRHVMTEEAFQKTIKDPGYLNLNMSSEYVANITYLIDLASLRGYKEMVSFLIKTGHITPLANPFCEAIMSDWCDTSEVIKLLIEVGVDVTRCRLFLHEGKGHTLRKYHQGKCDESDAIPQLPPLAYAIQKNKPHYAELLFEAGASLNDPCYYNPYNIDAEREKQKTIAELIESGELTLSNEMRHLCEKYSSKSAYKASL